MKRLVIVLGIIFLLLGTVCLVHPSFSYHKQEEVAKFGPFQATVDQENTVQIPLAVGAAMLAAGLVLVTLGLRRKL